MKRGVPLRCRTNPEARAELDELRQRLTDTPLRGILTDEAIMLAFLMLGSAMWRAAPAAREDGEA
jgi:hypothetical protein